LKVRDQARALPLDLAVGAGMVLLDDGVERLAKLPGMKSRADIDGGVEEVDVVHVKGNAHLAANMGAGSRVHAGDELLLADEQIDKDLVAHQLGDVHLGRQRLGADAGRCELAVVDVLGARAKDDLLADIGPGGLGLVGRELGPEGAAIDIQIAILLDDGGQKLDLVPAAAALPTEVGFAILPFLPKSTDTATALHQAGHEIWLHLPMEPQNYPTDDPGPGAVLMSMTAGELRAAVHSAINNIPHAVGVNNHMGSKATADLKTMTWIMQELKVRNLAFIDSRTTVRTVAEEAAKAQGVPTSRRHVFLDNERSPAAIRKQLDEAVFRSRMEGEIIAIGHIDEVTIAVLSEELPGLAKRKADLVKPSDLVR